MKSRLSRAFSNALVSATLLGLAAPAAISQEVITQNLIVQNSLCVGSDCLDGEEFDFDTVRLKSSDPVLQFLDTSNSGAFPSNDWSMGVANSSTNSAPQFFLRDDSGDAVMLILQSGESGGVALGANAVIEPGAISVGGNGNERRVAFVAEGTDPTDAATKGQLDAFISVVEGSVSDQLNSDRSALDTEIAELESELTSLASRLEALESALGN